MTVALIDDELFQQHVPLFSHPERPERLQAVAREITRRGLRERTAARNPRPATPEELGRVHSSEYIAQLSDAVPEQSGFLDGDTYFSPRTWEAATHAAGAAIDLSLSVLDPSDDTRAGFALVRPPGHHAEATRAMGFCLFNNVAIAAEAALAQGGAERVAILDWDVHHGNGTQHSFYARDDVLYLSVHRYPFYPGTGAADEIGKGKGLGFTVNVPLPGNLGDADYAYVFDRTIVPVIDQFAPDLLIVSAGFDAHRADPLGGMAVSDNGFAAMARKIRRAADAKCAGNLVAVLEGGYDIDALARCSCALLDEFLAEDDAGEIDVEGQVTAPTKAVVDRLKSLFGPHWKL